MDVYGIQLEIMLVLLGIGGLLAGVFWPRISARAIGGVLAVAVAGVLIYSFTIDPVTTPYFGGLYRLDAFALFFKRVLLAGTCLTLLLAMDSAALRSEGTEFSSLVLFAAAGMLLLASVNEFIFLFVALELVTICFYVLNSFLNKDAAVLEAGFKYLVLGALSASLTAYGISYIYGATGQTQFDAVRVAMMAGEAGAAYRFGFLLVLLGVGFKLAMVPLQVWAPDVYQGAPTPTSAFLASCSKVAGFVLLLRLVCAGLIPPDKSWFVLLAWLAGITLLYGTLGALAQTDLKRLLGYSSIAHAGYLLMGIAVGSDEGWVALAFYLTQYVFTVLCAFLVISLVGSATTTNRSALAGLSRRSPLLALALFVSMMSLAGVPPLSGAMAKFFILLSVMQRGAGDSLFYVLAGVGAVGAVISLFFYVGILRAAFVDADHDAEAIPLTLPARLALGVCLIAMVGLGVWPRALMTLLQRMM